MRSLVATQRDLRGIEAWESITDPESLSARSYALLMLGFTNCEGANYLLGRLLRAAGYDVWRYETASADEGDHRHLLIFLTSHGSGAFLDAWSDVPAMWVDGFEIDRACREWQTPRPHVERPLVGLPRYSDLSTPGGDVAHRGLFPRDAFLNGTLESSPGFDGVDPEGLRAAVEAFCMRAPTTDARGPETWRRYLRLRARHIDGTLVDPPRAYGELLEDPSLKGATRRLVRSLADNAALRSDGSTRERPAAATPPRARAPRRPLFHLDTRMRAGDVSVWPRWDPRPIDEDAMRAAWTDVFARRGQSGVPSTIRAYTHFAYCASSCNFCMYWHQVPSGEGAYERHVSYLVSRVEWHRSSFGRQPIQAAYFGGGTPTATPPDQLGRYLDAFTAAFDVRGEFSVEGHPTTTDPGTIRLLADAGVNRLSMGLQTLEHDLLVRITRRNAPLEHLGETVAAARARSMIVNLDLVLGLPGQSLESFRADVLRVTELGPDFVTMYLYEPVLRMPERPPVEMTYGRALTAELLASVGERGYMLADPLGPQQRSARLRRIDGAARPFEGDAVYAQFDASPSHTIALGPGAYGHVFGRYWYREVTSMGALGAGSPRYLGTTVTAADECRSMILHALEEGEPFSPEAIAEATGVDVRSAFSEAFALAEQRGIFRPGVGQIDIADREGREEVIDRIAPAPPRGTLKVLDDSSIEPALVVLRGDEGEDEADRAALTELCEVLRIPTRGLQICRDVFVGRRDGAALYFHVGGPKVQPLRIRVSVPRPSQASFFATERFAITFRTEAGGAPTPLEHRFLAWLEARILAVSRQVSQGSSRAS